MGLTDLFLSTDRRHHEDARALCLECPALIWCMGETAKALRTKTLGPGMHGTWAGVLYSDGKRIMGRVSIGHCTHCGAEDGEVCTSATGLKLGRPHRARILGRPRCGGCGDEFTPRSSANTCYCSEVCSQAARKAREPGYNAARRGRRSGKRVGA
jgi:hypothetical protein